MKTPTLWKTVAAWSVVWALALCTGSIHELHSQQAAADSLWIAPDELEPDFAMVWRSAETQDIPEPKWRLFGMAVSPDGRWLAYVDGSTMMVEAKLRVMDLRTGAIEVIADFGYRPLWSPDSKLLKYAVASGAGPDNAGTWFLNTETRERVRLKPSPDDTTGVDYMADTWGPDGNTYLINVHQREDRISLWRMPLKDVLRTGHFMFEPVGKGGLPSFPPGDTSWYVTYPGTDPPGEQGGDFPGFNIVRGFDWDSRRTVWLTLANPAWEASNVNSWGASWFVPAYSVGPEGEIYIHISFRAKSERDHWHTPPFSEPEMEARRASGWYRVDTTGTKRVQLISSVTHGLGLSITADGQKIYYGRLMPDSTCVVWEMNRWGREKRQVTFAGTASAVRNGDAAGGASLAARAGEGAGEIVVSIDMERGSEVDLVVVTMDGREVARPMRRQYLPAGRHERSLHLDGLASGTYLVSMVGAGSSPVVSATVVIGR